MTRREDLDWDVCIITRAGKDPEAWVETTIGVRLIAPNQEALDRLIQTFTQRNASMELIFAETIKGDSDAS